MRKWIVLAALAAVAWWFFPRARSGPGTGRIELDTAAYTDTSRDGVDPAKVVARRADAPSRPPNIVLVMADDLGYGDLGAYGNTLLPTPRIDDLARRGARFTQFYASHSNCSPSRAGMLTGRYPLRTGITFPIQSGRDDWRRTLTRRIGTATAELGAADSVLAGESTMAGIPASEILLPEALHLAGYRTALVGKWHLGDFSVRPEYHPRRHGFDFFAGFPASNDLFPYEFWRDETLVEENVGLRQGDVTARLVDEAKGFIRANRDQPFFLYFAEKNVHSPLIPSKRFAGTTKGGAYGDLVAELDWSIGELVDALAANGLLENTLFLFTSDNGPWHLGNPGALRGRKGQPMEGGQRVPFIATWPGHIPAGRVVDVPAMNFDLFPTILGLVGLDLPRDRAIDGRDLWPVISGSSNADPHDALFFFNANSIDGARSGRFKYYRWVNLYTWPVPLDKPNNVAGVLAHRYVYTDPVTGESVGLVTHDPLLFDVMADSNESYNLASAHPDETKRLNEAIDRWERDFVANPRGWKDRPAPAP